jgi:DNA-dependent RNA polymerase auxiliary subunit epsilon
MQRDEAARRGNTDESREMVLRQLLGAQDSPSESETKSLREMRDKLAWNAKYIDMLEELIVHYQKEVNFWKGRV